MIFEVSGNISDKQNYESSPNSSIHNNLQEHKRNLIFNIKKYHRNGLLEKKIMKKSEILKSGKWTREENSKFIRAGLKYEVIGTRTHAQIRSHAQKFLIKLCKKYNIEIKSKRKENFSLGHLNFPYKRKSEKSVVPIEKISNVDLNLIKKFNFYIKKVNLENFESRETIFEIKKTVKENFLKNEDICMEKTQNSNIFYSNLIIENNAQIFIQPPEKNPNILSTKSHFSKDTLLLVSKIIESNKEVISLLARCDFNYIINSPIFECINNLKKNI